jgi:hypothetical protein
MNYLDLLPDDLIEKINKSLIEAEIMKEEKQEKDERFNEFVTIIVFD